MISIVFIVLIVVSKRTLKDMDEAVENFKIGNVLRGN